MLLSSGPLELHLAQPKLCNHNKDLCISLPAVPGKQHSILCFFWDRGERLTLLFFPCWLTGCSLASNYCAFLLASLCSPMCWDNLPPSTLARVQPVSSAAAFLKKGRGTLLWLRAGRKDSGLLICILSIHRKPSRRFSASVLPLTDTGLHPLYKQHPPATSWV